ncbi:MAG TPA: hypothetical protein GYA10_10510 [Alphaproteobacteria bacterium]|nr:hypothetical protein [Alphaproteobacteria bacterium]
MTTPDPAPRGLFTARSAISGKYVSFTAPAPDLAAGDAQFLDESRPHELQTRPLLSSERTPNSIDEYPPGAQWLIYRSPTGKQLRAIIKVPLRYRRNVRSNMERAVEQVEKFDLAHGAMFRLALNGIDPFTQPFAIVIADFA